MDDPVWNATVFTKKRKAAARERDRPQILRPRGRPKRGSVGWTTRHAGWGVSERRRKRIEEICGWLKTIGLMRKTRHRGTRRVDWMLTFSRRVLLGPYPKPHDQPV